VFKPEFKAKVALDTLREDKTLVELSQKFELSFHANLEKKQLPSSAVVVFGAVSKRQGPVELNVR